ncbi:MAG: class I tRNA ligase family protein, partial [Fimbriimonadales bacterium]
MSLRIYDSLSRSLVDFTPRDPGKVTIYACGLTPQAPAHLGHMRGAVLFDVVRNWLEYNGLEVDFVQNFTDIDDKIIRRSAEEGISASEVAEKYGARYLKDLDLLGVRPARWVYVTKNMAAIIEMISTIIERGHAYEVEGDVYFRVLSLKDYGKL